MYETSDTKLKTYIKIITYFGSSHNWFPCGGKTGKRVLWFTNIFQKKYCKQEPKYNQFNTKTLTLAALWLDLRFPFSSSGCFRLFLLWSLQKKLYLTTFYKTSYFTKKLFWPLPRPAAAITASLHCGCVKLPNKSKCLFSTRLTNWSCIEQYSLYQHWIKWLTVMQKVLLKITMTDFSHNSFTFFSPLC